MSILIKPIVTEKTNKDSESFNRYTFVVDKNVNKIQIKDAVEATYNVTVSKVRTINVRVERKVSFTKSGVITGKKSGYKKAIVQLDNDDVIDFYSNL